MRIFAALAALLAAAAPVARSQGGARAVTITATASGFRLPASVRAGPVVLTLVNRGTRTVSAQLLAVRPDHTPEEAARTLAEGGQPPEWIASAGGIGPVAPGRSASLTQTLAEGGYVVASGLPDSGGQPQYRRGFIGTLTASGGGGEARVRGVTVVISAAGGVRFARVYDREGSRTELPGRTRSRPIEPGEVIFEVNAAGNVQHQLMLVRMDPVVPLRRWMEWLERGQPGEGPGTAVGGFGAGTGTFQAWLTVRLEPGSYRMFCAVPHRAGRRGYELGELAEYLVR